MSSPTSTATTTEGIDEEDYQAAQARGDEDLPPTWDEVLEDI